MRDPRLIEIEFLMDLERAGSLKARSTLQADGNGAGVHELKLYGEKAEHFRDLILHLLFNGLISGSGVRVVGGHGIDEEKLQWERVSLTKQFTSGQPIDILITHTGRVHLWSLRDALLRDPDIEPMGLRSKAAWTRDVVVQLQWATEEEPLAILFLDLDKFSAVNNELGHTVGDEVLRAAFTLTKNLVGARGSTYRYGGEEVGILLPNTSQQKAEALAEELRSVIESEVAKQVPRLGRAQTASIGAATFTARVEATKATDHVDALMYQAKKAGRNRVVSEPFGG